MKKHSDSFKAFLLEDHLHNYTKQLKEFTELTQKANLLQCNFLGQEIKQYSELSSDEYNTKLQSLLNNPFKAFDTEHEITGIEDSESVIYVKNLSPTQFQLTSFQNIGISGNDSTLYSGKIEIIKHLKNGKLPARVEPVFSGTLINNEFIRFENKNNPEMMKISMKTASMTFLEQLNLLTNNQKNNETIYMH